MAALYSPSKAGKTSKAPPSPSYSALAAEDPFSSVHRLSEDSSTGVPENSDGFSIMTAPPPYSKSTTFTPTHQLQIETVGKPWLSLPLPPRPDPIPVFAVGDTATPQFVSLRPTRRSGSCFLVAPSSSPSSRSTEGGEELHVPLSTTFYRCGPGRHPRVRLFAPGKATPTADPFADASSSKPEEEDGAVDLATWDAFELLPVGLLTRAITFRTRLGTFEWRYAGRQERRAAAAAGTTTAGGDKINSLLVLDRVVRVALVPPPPTTTTTKNKSSSSSSSAAREEVVRTPVAHFVRSDALRTPGSASHTAGNGGRLLVDLRLWEESDDGGEGLSSSGSKLDRDMGLVMVVTTCLAMLKKEVDRRRAHQIAIMAGAGGGP